MAATQPRSPRASGNTAGTRAWVQGWSPGGLEIKGIPEDGDTATSDTVQ